MDQGYCLVIGSGLMVPSLLSTLLDLGYSVTVAGNVQSELDSLQSSFLISTAYADVMDASTLSPLISLSKVVISMVPPRFHHFVLQVCISLKKNLVTPSYASPDMLALEKAAIEAGIVVLIENGLDPGIDHMSVVAKIQEIRAAGGKVLEFQSSCGAFPAPEACSNKLCYKLAWAPYGALFAAVRPAKYIENQQIVELEGKELMSSAKPYDLPFDLPIMYYPNGDSTIYPQKYGIEEARTVMRCTLRYEAYPKICRALVALGIYDERPREFREGFTWLDLLEELSGDVCEESGEKSVNSVWEKVKAKISTVPVDTLPLIFEAFCELGLLSSKPVVGKSIFSSYANLVSGTLDYLPGERDCVIMEHKYLVEYKNKQVRYRSRLVDFGVPNGGTSTISKLVSVPTALAADWICRNQHDPGFVYPMESNFCRDVLEKLEKNYNVKFIEEEEIVSNSAVE